MELLDEIKNLKETGYEGVEKLGLLENLNELEKIEIGQHIINFVNILDEENMFEIQIPNHHQFYMYSIPAIRRIMLILIRENKEEKYQIHHSNDNLLKIFDSKDFAFYLKDMIQHLDKMSFLKNIDYEVEFLSLLCENYINILKTKS